MTDDLAEWSASALAPLLATGQLTVERVARSCLERVQRSEADVRAWAHLAPDAVIAQARALDLAGPRGPLFGIPVGVKDVILTKDMPTQYNSPIYQGFQPAVDAACVATLRAAGALIFGKTETVEFAATGRPAPTRNPHDLARTPGGSSSGSGAAVAGFHVPVALGTQTGGSIIRPASYCGVYGFKPTWNLVSREGAKMFAASLDTVGWFARSAADLALMLQLFDPAPAPPPFTVTGARIALCHSPVWDQADADTRTAMATAAERLRSAGAIVTDLVLPAPFADLPAAQLLIMRSEARSAFLANYRSHAADLHDSLRAMVENECGITRAQLCAAYDLAASCRRDFDRIAADVDAILTPSTVGCAPIGLSATGPLTFNAIWSLLQVPVANVPGLTGNEGLPVGLSLVGARFSDHRVLAAAGSLGAIFAPLSV